MLEQLTVIWFCIGVGSVVSVLVLGASLGILHAKMKKRFGKFK